VRSRDVTSELWFQGDGNQFPRLAKNARHGAHALNFLTYSELTQGKGPIPVGTRPSGNFSARETYTLNDDPQPQVLLTFGFSNLKPAPSRVST
jgi:hypothetical protein